MIQGCGGTSLFGCSCTETATDKDGIHVYMTSYCIAHSCTLSNRQNGIYCYGSLVSCYACSGTGNTIGLHVLTAGIIGKYLSVPGGTTAEYAVSGGIIR